MHILFLVYYVATSSLNIGNNSTSQKTNLNIKQEHDGASVDADQQLIRNLVKSQSDGLNKAIKANKLKMSKLSIKLDFVQNFMFKNTNMHVSATICEVAFKKCHRCLEIDECKSKIISFLMDITNRNVMFKHTDSTFINVLDNLINSTCNDPEILFDAEIISFYKSHPLFTHIYESNFIDLYDLYVKNMLPTVNADIIKDDGEKIIITESIIKLKAKKSDKISVSNKNKSLRTYKMYHHHQKAAKSLKIT